MWIKDFPSKIVLLNLTASLKTGKTVIEKEYGFIHPGKENMLYSSNYVFALDEGMFLMDKASARSNNSDEKDSGPMYILYDSDKKKSLDTLKYNCILPLGWSCMNEKKSEIVSISYRMDVISLYDINKRRQLILCQTPREPQELYGLTAADKRLKVFHSPFVYSACLMADELIMGLFKRNKSMGDNGNESVCYIHIFNEEGNPLYNMIIKENIEAICYDNNASVLYGMDEDNQLYLYNLREILQNKKSRD